MKKFFAVMFVLCSANFTLFSCQSIKQIDSYDDVDFESITPDTLVVFDVDNTLIRSLQNEEEVYQEVFHEYLEINGCSIAFFFLSGNSKKEAMDAASSLLLREYPCQLIEKQIICTIKKLQEKGVSVIACEATKTGEFGLIESMEELRYNHLSSLGFQGSFTDRAHSLYTENGKPRCPDLIMSNLPVFYKGIIYTNSHSKGKCLGAFLDTLNSSLFDGKKFKFKKIIMFDDKGTYLSLGSVVEECKKRNMDCDAYLYQGSVAVPYEQEDLEKQKAQARYLARHEKWPNDQELELFLEKEERGNKEQGKVKK